MQECMLAKDVIAQLQTIGDMEEWEIFVAMHLLGSQGASETDPQDKLTDSTAMIKALLHRYAEKFQVEEKAEFLKAMHIPSAWVSEASAVWAKYCNDTEGIYFTWHLSSKANEGFHDD